MVARGLLDTLRAVEEMDEEVFPVFNAMVKLSQDSGKLTDWLLRNHFFRGNQCSQIMETLQVLLDLSLWVIGLLERNR